MSLVDFLAKQFISVIQWNEPEDGILAYRYPMRDMEIQNGGQLTVSESQVAAFVNEGRIADIFGPGLHTLNTRNLPILTDLMNWAKDFESPFKSEVYFFSTRLRSTRSGEPRRRSRSVTASLALSVCAASASTPTASSIRASSSTRLAARATSILLPILKGNFATPSSPTWLPSSPPQTFRFSISPPTCLLGSEDRRSAEAGVRSARSRTRAVQCRECLAARRTHQGPRPAHRHGDGGRRGPLYAVRRCRVARPGSRQHRRWRGRGHGAGRRRCRCPSALYITQSVGRSARGCACCYGSCRRCCGTSRSSRGRHQVLYRLRKAHPGPLALLSRLRPDPVNCPSCGAPITLRPDTEGYSCAYCHAVFFPVKRTTGSRFSARPSDRSLDCPLCRVPLVQAAFAKIPLLYCTQCHGLLMPMNELIRCSTRCAAKT